MNKLSLNLKRIYNIKKKIESEGESKKVPRNQRNGSLEPIQPTKDLKQSSQERKGKGI